MKQLPSLKKEISVDPLTEERTITFTGAGMLIGSLGSKDLFFTENSTGIQKSYRLATVKVNVPNMGEKNLLLQVHEDNLKNMIGLKAADDWESEDQKEDAIEAFESGEIHLTTVRTVRKNDDSGWTLLGSMSHELYDKFKKFVGVYRYIDYMMDGQEYFLIILKSRKALLLYDKSKERINLNIILDLYEESYDTYESMVDTFKDKIYESTLNRFTVINFDNNSIQLESTYNRIFDQPTYQCLRLEAKIYEPKDIKSLKSLRLNSFSLHTYSPNAKIIQKTQKMSDAQFSKFL